MINEAIIEYLVPLIKNRGRCFSENSLRFELNIKHIIQFVVDIAHSTSKSV